MKEKIKSLYGGRGLPVALMFSASLSAIMLYVFRFVWVFVNIAVKAEAFMLAVQWVMIANAITLGVLSAIRLYEIKGKNGLIYKKKGYSILLGVLFGVTVLSLIIAVVFLIITALRESAGVSFEYLKALFPKASVFVLVPALALVLPKLSGKAKKAVICACIAAAFIAAVASVFPLMTYEITSDPVVIDNGKEYSVVFATTDYGTGYVTYSFEGRDYKLFDETAGRLNRAKLHSVCVPYEHLKNNEYAIGSTRVIEEYSYGSRLGKEVVSKDYMFAVNESEKQTYLAVSDWHTNLEGLYAAAENAGAYDAVILLGDATPGIDFENEAVRNIVEAGGYLSGGEMPVIFARGNHETRGAFAAELPDALGMEQMYFTAKFGDVAFVVLDSGEDKDDSHPEYGGMNNYAAYRQAQLEWLKGINVQAQRLIVLSHSWKISDVETEISDAAWQELDRLGADLVVSGHSHNCRFVGDADEREREIAQRYPDIKAYMDGGNAGEQYVASKLTITDESILIQAYSDKGEKVFDGEVNE